MNKQNRTLEDKKLDTDLWIIGIVSFTVLGLYMAFKNQITSVTANSNVNILLRLLIMASFQFGLTGLGITIISIIRKESFILHGLRVKGTLVSICLCVLCFVPHIVFTPIISRLAGYMPFQQVWTTTEILASGFPINVIGMTITAIAWGFFEGFNYVIISDKINIRYPSKNRWLNWGAIVCSVLCILVHGAIGAIGVTLGSIIEMLSIMIIVYGMIVVKTFTKNAWGCIFIFIFLWNAF